MSNWVCPCKLNHQSGVYSAVLTLCSPLLAITVTNFNQNFDVDARRLNLYASKCCFQHILFHCDLQLWPFDPKMWRRVHITCPKMHQCFKFDKNSSNAFQYIVLTLTTHQSSRIRFSRVVENPKTWFFNVCLK